jgi:hypothetical protein
MSKKTGPHVVNSWYGGPALQPLLMPPCLDLQAKYITNTLHWFHRHVPMPTTSSDSLAIAATQDLLTALQNPKHPSPFTPLPENNAVALKQFLAIFTNENDQPPVSDATQVPIPPVHPQP